MKAKTKKYYYNNRVLLEKTFFGKEYADNYVRVKVLGETDIPVAMIKDSRHKTETIQYFLIELPGKEKKKIPFYELFIEWEN